MAMGIYQIFNKTNGKKYVGSSVNIKDRWTTHKRLLRHGKHRNKYLQNAWNKYGEKCFLFLAIENIENADALVCREQYYIDMLKPEYNLSPTAGRTLGIKLTKEQRQKKKGQIPWNKGKTGIYTKETQRKRSAALKAYYNEPENKRKRESIMAACAKSVDRELLQQFGESNGGAKLRDKDVREIKALLQGTKLRQHEIADMYNVTSRTINSINTGERWAHVNPEEPCPK